MQGKIIKGIAGFYYVHVDCGESRVYECKAKGVFRKDNRKPLVGDDVEMEVLDEAKKLGYIRELLPRHSELIRPAVANVDQAMVIFSITKPKPNFNLLDRFLIMMGQQDIPCIICFNKQDIDEDNEGKTYQDIYGACGYRTVRVSAVQGTGIEHLKTMLAGKTTTVAGPSGVGKSSIVNCLQSGTVMETGQISAKIQRGKHTTRHSELLAAGEIPTSWIRRDSALWACLTWKKNSLPCITRSLPNTKNIAGSGAAPILENRSAASGMQWKRAISAR